MDVLQEPSIYLILALIVQIIVKLAPIPLFAYLAQLDVFYQIINV